jgi:hypothetical protein
MACRTNRCGCGTCGQNPCGCGPCGCGGGCGGGCSGNGPNYVESACGMKTVVSSRLVDGGKYRRVEYANGCCDKIARTWVPQTYDSLPGNGPKPLSRCVGGNVSNTESECMDCMNGMFNHGVR